MPPANLPPCWASAIDSFVTNLTTSCTDIDQTASGSSCPLTCPEGSRLVPDYANVTCNSGNWLGTANAVCEVIQKLSPGRVRIREATGDGLDEGAVLAVVLIILILPAAIVAIVVLKQQRDSSKAADKYQSFDEGQDDRVMPLDTGKPIQSTKPSGNSVPAKPKKEIVHTGFNVGGKHETTTSVKVRDAEGADSTILTSLKAQVPFTILEIGSERSRAKIKAEEVEGWINLWTNKGVLVVTRGEKGFRVGEQYPVKKNTKIRDGEKSDSAVTGVLKPGTVITIMKLGRDASRAKVSGDGQEGWMLLWNAKGEMLIGEGGDAGQPVVPVTKGNLPGQPLGLDDEDSFPPSEAESDAGSEACRSLGEV